MNFWAKRRLRKLVKLTLQMVRHSRRMREDVAGTEQVEAAESAEKALAAAWTTRNWDEIEALCGAAVVASEGLMPPRRFPKWRENIEVLVVAISLAMACRTYFIQPFKIPTGSMQPTLFGVTATPQEGRQLRDRFPLNVVNLVLFGERYVEVRAKAGGLIDLIGIQNDQYAFRVGRQVHLIRLAMKPGSLYFNPDPERSLQLHFRPGDRVQAGQLLASGRVRMGDHIFVNKVGFHLSRPKRGQIVVFDTNYIPGKEALGILENTFYIKRLVGLGGERISIRDRHLVVNGEAVEEPYAFKRQVSDPAYHGYVLRDESRLSGSRSAITVGAGEFLPFGDNTYSSLDGRYFGPVPERGLVGPAFFVYWPFGGRWGMPK